MPNRRKGRGDLEGNTKAEKSSVYSGEIGDSSVMKHLHGAVREGRKLGSLQYSRGESQRHSGEGEAMIMLSLQVAEKRRSVTHSCGGDCGLKERRRVWTKGRVEQSSVGFKLSMDRLQFFV